MAIAQHIRRRDYSSASTDRDTELNDNSLSFDRQIYQRLGDLFQNRSLVTPVVPRDNFDRWLLDMNKLSDAKTAGDISSIDQSIIEFDEYLSTLNYTDNIYPFLQDFFETVPWLSIDSQTEFRILVDESDNTYLTDTNDEEVLVSFT